MKPPCQDQEQVQCHTELQGLTTACLASRFISARPAAPGRSSPVWGRCLLSRWPQDTLSNLSCLTGDGVSFVSFGAAPPAEARERRRARSLSCAAPLAERDRGRAIQDKRDTVPSSAQFRARGYPRQKRHRPQHRTVGELPPVHGTIRDKSDIVPVRGSGGGGSRARRAPCATTTAGARSVRRTAPSWRGRARSSGPRSGRRRHRGSRR